MTQTIWTESETQKVIELHKTLTLSQIAKEMGRSKDSVRHRLKWLKDKQVPQVPTTIKAVQKEEERQAKEEKVKEPKPLRKKEKVGYVSYPPLEWCPTCHSPVSNWSDHTSRLGCRRPL